jgi:hypothetical protein
VSFFSSRVGLHFFCIKRGVERYFPPASSSTSSSLQFAVQINYSLFISGARQGMQGGVAVTLHLSI